MAKYGTATARLVTGMRFDTTSGSGHTILLDPGDAEGGQSTGPTPMELLLMGLAGCTGMDVISILRKKRQDVTAYEIRVHGTRADEHPMVYQTITVEHRFTGHQIDPRAVQRAIELSETKYCGVGATLAKTATITNTFTIVEE